MIINKGNVITMKTTKVYSESVVSKILDLLENATNSKAKTETIVSRISKFYTPIVIILAILVILLLPQLFNMDYSDSIYRGLTFLVISCPSQHFSASNFCECSVFVRASI